MPPQIPHTLICTIGTSLIYRNLASLPKNEDDYPAWLNKQPEEDRQYLSKDFIINLQALFAAKNFKGVAESLVQLPGNTRLCGAEINSITDLIAHQYCQENSELFFCHSQTPEGQNIVNILENYYQQKGYQVKTREIKGLQDQKPKLFRTKGLRNLAKTVSQTIREKNHQFCAINATGGYKAQIAIAVLIGQALEVPVYYKHERFSEIIAFPPMPIALDFNLWLAKSGLLTILEREGIIEWSTELDEDWDEKIETLIEREDGCIYLSATGQVFHETFKGRFESDRDAFLPPPIPNQQKVRPVLTDHSWGNARPKIIDFLQKITEKCSYVKKCRTHYWNPDLSSPIRFRKKEDQVEGILSNGSWTVKFYVDTSANTEGQVVACIADLNSRVQDFE